MSFTSGKSAISEYSQVKVQTGVEEMKPHRLIQMLMEGALEKISKARGFIERGDIAGKGENIGSAISIIEGLRVSLDKNAGGDIANNLDMLYEYMGRRLLEANISNNQEYLTEVAGLLLQIKDAWDQIPREIIEQHASKVKNEADKDST